MFDRRPTNNIHSFLSDLGLQQHRLDGDDYLAVIDEFMEAVFTRWPNVIVQVLKLRFKIKIVACICILFIRSIFFYFKALNFFMLTQFEDFQSKWAFKLLQRYRTTYRMFNDDVQVKSLLYAIIACQLFFFQGPIRALGNYCYFLIVLGNFKYGCF